MNCKLIPTAIALAAALTGSCPALTPLVENFNGNQLNQTRWHLTQFGKAKLVQANGKLNFVVSSKPTADDHAVIELLGNQPGFNESWDLIVDVSNTTKLGYDSACGVMLLNSLDRRDYFFLNFYGKGTFAGLSTALFVDGRQLNNAELSANPGVAKGSIRFRFNRTTKLMTISFSTTRKAAGYVWKKIGTFSPTGKGGDVRANWKMNTGGGRFRILLFGLGVSELIQSNKVTLDNLTLSAP